ARAHASGLRCAARGFPLAGTHGLSAPGIADDDATGPRGHDDAAPVAAGRGPFTVASRAGAVMARARPARTRPC
ncbi:MAG TPA: hypothetical protein VFT38_17500, partial [Vicinamibacteria bacterium]|nr:hypothetical protein [Vicinamibacteria bacterium]